MDGVVNISDRGNAFNNSLIRHDSAEENMLIMDKVMTTLDQIVGQLDDMNQGLTNIEKRIVNLENKKTIVQDE